MIHFSVSVSIDAYGLFQHTGSTFILQQTSEFGVSSVKNLMIPTFFQLFHSMWSGSWVP